MNTSLAELLPEPTESVRCADYARGLALDPVGTAIRADRVVIVAVPLPWPKPALAHPMLVGLRDALDGSDQPVRLLAAVPDPGRTHDVVVFDRTDGGAVERRFVVDDGGDGVALAAFGAALAGGEAEPARLLSQHDTPDPAVLVCTQGSHDICCGSDGARLATELTADPLLGGQVSIYRVSHTGGHRFAPTIMTLPDGRMWAYVDRSAVEQIVAASTHGPAPTHELDPGLAGRCRGWWGADTGPAQVAERAVFAEIGWPLDLGARAVSIVDEPEPGRVVCRVDTDHGAWMVAVIVGREVPTIACREPGGHPAKPGREYAVASVDAVD